MESSSKPSGPEFAPPRRVFTAPTYHSAPPPAASSQATDGVVETLYDHPSVKIVSFAAGSRQVSFGSRSGFSQPPDVEPGSLAWTSHLERTIAVGPFRIYRAPGSVAFLNCGSALQPILPKSQVWCVDEDSSKFILQIRRPQYWRIEVPVVSDEDIQRAQLLRQVLDKILQFEKTECPFRRSFTVELPEPPQTPIKKRPWTPVQKPYSLPPTPVTPAEIARIRMDVAKMDPILTSEIQESLSDPEKGTDEAVDLQELPDADVTSANQDDNGGSPESGQEKLEPRAGAAKERLPHPLPLKLGTTFPALRSVTAPPQLTLNASPPSKVREEGRTESARIASRSQSPTESQGSFHSVKSWDPSSLPPSPPLSNPTSPLGSSCPNEVTGESLKQEDPPELASISNISPTWSTTSPTSDFDGSVTAPSSTYDVVEISSSCSEAVTEEHVISTSLPEESHLDGSASALAFSSTSHSSSSEVTHRPPIRRRGTTSSTISPSRSALSPLPSAANLFAPRKPQQSSNRTITQKLVVVGRLPMAIIQTTRDILMSPPSHLINLMLRVAARIAAGEWRGMVFGTDEHGEQIPVHWDWSDDEDGDGSSSHWRGGERKNSCGWLPLTSQKMAGTFPESDDEDWDHLDTDLAQTQSNETDQKEDHIRKAITISENTALDTTRINEDWSGSLGVD